MKAAGKEQESAPEEDKEKVRDTFKALAKAAFDQIEGVLSEDAVKGAFEKIEAMKGFVSLHTYHLQTYELQTFMEDIKAAETKLQEKRDKLPKKKFQFSSKAAPKPAALPVESKKVEAESTDPCPIALSENDISVRGTKGATIVETPTPNKENCYCYLGENEGSVISIDPGISIKQLYCNKNSNCTLTVGKVLGSALIYNCVKCKFIISAHQVRIHKCQDCEFTLFANSGPVIEDSAGLQFREIPSENIPETYKGVTNRCAEVMDFNWHKKEKSPNWTFLSK